MAAGAANLLRQGSSHPDNRTLPTTRGIAIVRVLNKIVGRGYEIRVGANDSNLKYHGFYKRMDRVTSTFPVVANKTTIASPLGGGIYIRVPYLADDGIIDVQIIGPVVQAPIFCEYMQP